jgi:hypothetical protein
MCCTEPAANLTCMVRTQFVSQTPAFDLDLITRTRAIDSAQMRAFFAHSRLSRALGRLCVALSQQQTSRAWYAPSFLHKLPHLTLFWSTGHGLSNELECGRSPLILACQQHLALLCLLSASCKPHVHGTHPGFFTNPRI